MKVLKSSFLLSVKGEIGRPGNRTYPICCPELKVCKTLFNFILFFTKKEKSYCGKTSTLAICLKNVPKYTMEIPTYLPFPYCRVKHHEKRGYYVTAMMLIKKNMTEKIHIFLLVRPSDIICLFKYQVARCDIRL